MNRPTAAQNLPDHPGATMPRQFSRGMLAVVLALTSIVIIARAHSPRRTPINPDDLVLEPVAILPAGADAEVSGMIPSGRHAHVFWTLGDSGNAASLYPVRFESPKATPSGAPLQLPPAPGVAITNATNRDWEDLTRDAAGHLIIADLGNNDNDRKDLCFYFVDEPEPDAKQSLPARTLRVEYPDQEQFPSPRDRFNFDAEAVFTVGDDLYVLTKHRSDTFTSMYKVTDPDAAETSTLEYVDRFDVKGQVTGAAASADGLQLAVLTYSRIWLFSRQSTRTPFFAGSVSGRTYRYARGASVSESICFEDARTLLITDENRASIARVPLSDLRELRKGVEPPTAADQSKPPLAIASFNLRYAGADDGPNKWDRRKAGVRRMLEHAAADIMGFQEVEAVQADWLKEQFPAFSFHGVGRADGARRGEFAPILFRSTRFTLERSGHFWLSETPEIPGSRGWDGACERMASWVLLNDQTCNRTLFVLNTHLDHVGQLARKNGLELIRARIAALAGDACTIVTGDFNLSADSELARTLIQPTGEHGPALADTFRTIFPTKDSDEATFNGFKRVINGERIDWILASPGLTPLGATIERAQPGGTFASDHFMVTATLRYRRAMP